VLRRPLRLTASWPFISRHDQALDQERCDHGRYLETRDDQYRPAKEGQTLARFTLRPPTEEDLDEIAGEARATKAFRRATARLLVRIEGYSIQPEGAEAPVNVEVQRGPGGELTAECMDYRWPRRPRSFHRAIAYAVSNHDRETGRPRHDCRKDCRRGTPSANRERMRAFRCGYGPADGGIYPVERSDAAPRYVVDEITADVCPLWYVQEHAPWLSQVLEAEQGGMTLTRRDPAVLVASVALVRRTRAAREHEAWEAAERRRQRRSPT